MQISQSEAENFGSSDNINIFVNMPESGFGVESQNW